MNISSRAAVVAIVSLFFAGSALAQTTAPAAAPAATAPAKKAEKAEKPRSPESMACSKQADDKGLHGKDRKKFRSDCMKEAKGAKGGAADQKK